MHKGGVLCIPLKIAHLQFQRALSPHALTAPGVTTTNCRFGTCAPAREKLRAEHQKQTQSVAKWTVATSGVVMQIKNSAMHNYLPTRSGDFRGRFSATYGD
jgi:hypothetical protein